MNDSWVKKLFKANSNKDKEKQQNVGVALQGEPQKNKTNPNNIVITIGRELGSGGRKVAKEVAKKLDYEYYDKSIITKAAKKSGIDKALFSQVDESNLDSFWFDFSKEAYDKDEKKISYKEITAADKLFMIQSDVIRDLAKKGGSVIVGRCSTYILKDESKRVFICANEKDRIERIKRSYKVSSEVAKEIMEKSDRKRENYHSYYTNQNWKDKNNYDLYINTSEVGVEKAIEMIINLIKE